MRFGARRFLWCAGVALGVAVHAEPEARPPADPAAEYVERSGKLAGKKDPNGWLALADFCEDHLLFEQRTEALRKAGEADPDNPQAEARLDEGKWDGKWLPVAEAETLESEKSRARGLVFYGDRWVAPKEAEKARDADRKTQGWDLDFRMNTPHLVLFSTRSLEATRHVAGLLENELRTYQRIYGSVWKPDPKFKSVKVYLLPDRDAFERVLQAQARYAPGEMMEGFFALATQTLYVGFKKTLRMPKSQASTETSAVHEMSHALDHLMSRHTLTEPLWMQEGRAEYLGYSVTGRQVLPGAEHIPLDDGLLDALEQESPGADLHALLALNEADFMGKSSGTHYVLSWAFVHFLFHGEGGKHAAGFRAYLAGVLSKGSVDEFEKVVGKARDLEPAFKDYVRRELLPQGRVQSRK